jgi:hypothetical protein
MLGVYPRLRWPSSIGACLRGLEAVGMAAFCVLDAWLVCSLFGPLVMPQESLIRAVKIQEASPERPALFCA